MRTPGNEMTWKEWNAAARKALRNIGRSITLEIALELEELYDEGYTPEEAAKDIHLSRTTRADKGVDQ